MPLVTLRGTHFHEQFDVKMTSIKFNVRSRKTTKNIVLVVVARVLYAHSLHWTTGRSGRVGRPGAGVTKALSIESVARSGALIDSCGRDTLIAVSLTVTDCGGDGLRPVY